MIAQTQFTEPTRGVDQLPRTVSPFAVTSKQCRETIEQSHEISRLSSRTFHIHAIRNNLMKRSNTTFHFVKYDSQIQAGHACRKKCFLHISIMIFDSDYVLFKFFPSPL